MKKTILILTVLLAVCLIFTSCSDRRSSGEIYTVTFDLAGGSWDSENHQLVKDGETVSRPSSSPVKTGYSFVRWSLTEDGKISYDFNTPVTSNTVIYAVWQRIYTVTFNLGGGVPDEEKQILKAGEKVTRPKETPTRTGYDFYRWSDTANGTTEFDFNKEITDDTTIYAVWNRVYNVKFDTNGGEGKILSQEVRAGKKAVLPEDKPTRGGFSFDCWTKGDIQFDFNNDIITEDTTLKARWKYNEYAIGDKGPAGGIICYDNGKVETSYYIPFEGEEEVSYTWRYLERSDGIVGTATYSEQKGFKKYNTHDKIGCGKGNTYKLLREKDYDHPAARRCYEYGKDTKYYHDWFLPSRYELKAIYNALIDADKEWMLIDETSYFWTSSEFTDFDDGSKAYVTYVEKYPYDESKGYCNDEKWMSYGNELRFYAVRAF